MNQLREALRATARRRDAVTAASAVLLAGLVWLALNPQGWPGWALTAGGAGALFAAYRWL
jgi:ferric-dicitrate binding protein FerR (iron transport regulator)